MPRRVGRHVLHQAHQDLQAEGQGNEGTEGTEGLQLHRDSGRPRLVSSVYHGIIPSSCVLHASLRLNAKMQPPLPSQFFLISGPPNPLITVFPGTTHSILKSPHTHILQRKASDIFRWYGRGINFLC